MGTHSTITSKGQVTVPVEIRRKLGLKQGDKVEFHERGDETVITRAAPSKDPFDKYLGILKRKVHGPFNSREWVADLRNEE